MTLLTSYFNQWRGWTKSHRTVTKYLETDRFICFLISWISEEKRLSCSSWDASQVSYNLCQWILCTWLPGKLHTQQAISRCSESQYFKFTKSVSLALSKIAFLPLISFLTSCLACLSAAFLSPSRDALCLGERIMVYLPRCADTNPEVRKVSAQVCTWMNDLHCPLGLWVKTKDLQIYFSGIFFLLISNLSNGLAYRWYTIWLSSPSSWFLDWCVFSQDLFFLLLPSTKN